MRARRLPQIRALMRRPALLAAFLAYCSVPAWADPSSNSSSAQERAVTSAGDDRPLMQYRRVFVPARNLAAWPRDGEKLLPIEADEFEAWVEAANRVENDSISPVTISEAQYTARLEGERLVSGNGQWKVELHNEAPAFLPLGKLSLSIKNARWKDAPQTPVQLGYWGGHGLAAVKFGLAVPRSGTLEFDWSAPAAPDHDGLEIPWRLPRATRSRVYLDLPEGYVPTIDEGITVSTSGVPPSLSTGIDLSRWEVCFNASEDATLKISGSRPGEADVAASTTLHDNTEYQLTARGLDLITTWTLTQTVGELPNELDVRIPRDLQLVSAVADGVELHRRAMAEADGAHVRLTIQIPATPKQRTLEIVLRASLPLSLDQPWKLPKIQPENVYWTSGDIQLTIADDLGLRAINPVDCVERLEGGLRSGSDQPETWRLTAYAPTARLEVQVSRRPSEALLRLGSSLVMGNPDITGRHIAQWNVIQGKVHNLSGELAPGWVIETVETVPAEALGEWFVDQRDGRRRLDIQLAAAVRDGRDVSVIISGRLPRSLDADRLDLHTLRMVEWADGQVTEHVLAFDASEPFTVEAIGRLPSVRAESLEEDEGQEADPQTAGKGQNGESRPAAIATALKQLLAGSDTTRGSYFDLNQAGKDAGLKLTMKRGQYAASSSIEAMLSGPQLHLQYRVAIAPKSGRVHQVFIASTGLLGENVRWSDAASGLALVSERVPADDPRSAGLPAGGEMWMVRLPLPSTAPVELVATASHELSKRTSAPLLAFPEAIEQSGRVFVRAGMEVTPMAEPLRLSSVPLPAQPAENGSADGPPIRAAYRYEPVECLESAAAPQLWLTPSPGRNLSGLVARHVALESYFSPNGEATHRATYHLRNDGGEFAWRLPPDSTLGSVSIDGQAVPLPIASTSQDSLSGKLAVPNGQVVVEICFNSRQEPLAIGSRLMPPLVMTDSPLLTGEWNLRLPDDFSTSQSASLNWRQRLFGPLGRPDGAQPFQPLRASSWTSLLNSITAAWTGSEPRTEPLAGWRTEHIRFVAAEAPDALVLRPSASHAWTACLFLVSVVGGAWLRRRGVLVAGLAVAAGLAFLLPIPWAPLAAGVGWGLVLSIFVPTPRPRGRERRDSTHWHRYSTVGGAVTVILVGLTNMAFGQGGATVPGNTNAERPNSVHRVLIPVDEDGNQSGTKYYVDEKFARELLGAAAQSTPAARQWLLRDVAYRGELRDGVEPTGTVAGEFTITCDIEVLARDTAVALPFSQDDAAWSSSALLDGVPLPITWRDGGRGCTVEIAEPGRYSLEFSLVPRTAVTQGKNVLSLAVQPLPGAKLVLDLPPGFDGLSLLGTTAGRKDQAADDREFELDGSDRLELRWPASEVSLRAGAGHVTQLEWLRIVDGGVTLTTKYIFEGKPSQSAEVIVAFDSDWEFVQADNSDPKAAVINDSDHRKSVRLQLPANDAERRELVLQWRLATERSLGRLKLPPIELVAHPVSQRWRGVSAASAVECEVTGDGASSGTAAEFLAMWGGDAESPQVVLGNVQPGQWWNVSARPRPANPEISQVLHVAAEARKLAVVFRADIVPGSVPRHQFPLLVTSQMSIDDLVATQDNRRIPLRWSRLGGDRVNVFLGETLLKRFQIELRGTLGTLGDEVPLPLVFAADSQSAATVQLYRGDNVALDVQNLPEPSEALNAPLQSPPEDWIVRHVAGYQLDLDSAAKVRLQVQPNQVELTGDTLTTLTKSADGWLASFKIHAAVTRGELDVLRLRVPSGWSNAPALDSNVPASLAMDASDGRGATLSIRFAEAIPTGSELKLRIDSTLASAQASVSMPHIRPTPPIRGDRYLCVPAQIDGRPVAWNTSRLKTAQLPAALQISPESVSNTRVFQCTARTFRLAPRPQIGAAVAARVRMADTTVYLDPRGGKLISTRLIVEPNDSADFTLRLPDGQELVAARVAGLPALAEKKNQQDWRISLGSPLLPSILEVSTRTIEPEPDNRRTLIERPALLTGNEPVAVEINLWTIGYAGTMARPAIDVTHEATADEQAVLRFDHLLNIAEKATTAAVQLPAPDGFNWYRPWSAMLMRMRSEALDALARPDRRRAPSQVSRPTEEQLAASSARLEAWIERCKAALAVKDASDTSSTLSGIEPPIDSAVSDSRWVYCVTDGALDRLVLRDEATSADWARSPLLGVLSIAGLLVAAIVLARTSKAADLVYRWPHAVAFLFGLACWAWLQPSWLGLVIAAASVGVAVRAGRLGRAIRLEASTVLRAK